MQGGFTINVHDDEVELIAGSHIFIILFLCEFLYVVAHREHVALQCVVAFLLGGGVVIVDECLERHFGVNRHIAFVGEVQYHVGYHALSAFIIVQRVAIVVAQRGLLLKLHTLLESHVLEQCAQAQLAKVTLRLILACKRLGKLVGTLAHLLCLSEVLLDSGIELYQAVGLVSVVLFNSLTHLVQLLLQGSEQHRHLFAVGGR